MVDDLENVLHNYIGKEVIYKGINYEIEEIRNTSLGIKMVFLRDDNGNYFEPSFNLLVDEILNLDRKKHSQFNFSSNSNYSLNRASGK